MSKDISARQEEIIKVSGKILMEKGIKGLTIKILAKEMGFSESAIYRHFESKEDIIFLLLSTLKESLQKRVSEIIKSDLSATEKLETIFERQIEYVNENPYFIIAVLSEDLFFETDKIQEALLTLFNFKLKMVSKLIEEGKTTNNIRTDIETEDLANTVIGSFRFLMLRWRYSKFSFDLETEGRKTIDTITQLIKKQA
ncbi:MAG: TetR/AcrR family transcriptional regulator [Crocinitomicaceae bacterium]